MTNAFRALILGSGFAGQGHTAALRDVGVEVVGMVSCTRDMVEQVATSLEIPYVGPDMGADIPVRSEFTRNMAPLLQKYGNDSRLTLILFTLDETTYARELAPLAGHYPVLKLGPPRWFHDSLNGMYRYFDQVMETAGLYNTVGFNDDTRAFPSMPARHEMWRRASVNWLADLVTQGIVDMEDAASMAYEMAYGLAKRAYKLEERI